MPSIRLTPASENPIICDHAALFPATDFTFLDKDTGLPIDLTDYEADLEVFEVNGGALTLEWHTSDDTITREGADNNIFRLAEKTDTEMSAIAAKTYAYNFWVYPTGTSRVKFSYGKFIVSA